MFLAYFRWVTVWHKTRAKRGETRRREKKNEPRFFPISEWMSSSLVYVLLEGGLGTRLASLMKLVMISLTTSLCPFSFIGIDHMICASGQLAQA